MLFDVQAAQRVFESDESKQPFSNVMQLFMANLLGLDIDREDLDSLSNVEYQSYKAMVEQAEEGIEKFKQYKKNHR